MDRKYRRRRNRRSRMRRDKSGAPRRSLRMGVSTVHRFKETALWGAGPLAATANATSAGIITFKLGDLNNILSFKSLFDLFKITGVRVKILPRWSSGDVLASSTFAAGFPLLYIAENRDPYVPAPISVGDILNDDGCKIIRLNKPVNLYLKNPKAEIKDAEGVSLPFQFNSSSTRLQPWLTTGGSLQSLDQSGVEHFGYRYWLDNSQCTSLINVDVYITYYFSMKEQD